MLKHIPRFKGYYASDSGVIYSAKSGGLRPLRPEIISSGYEMVFLSQNGKSIGRTVHTLVLEAFVGPRPEGHEAAHENDIKTDNRLSNLSWKSNSHNKLDTHRTILESVCRNLKNHKYEKSRDC